MKTNKITNMSFEIHTYAPEMNKAFYPNGKKVEGFVPSVKVSCARKCKQFAMAMEEYREFREKKRKKTGKTMWKVTFRKGASHYNLSYIGEENDTFVSIHKRLRKSGCKDIKVVLS